MKRSGTAEGTEEGKINTGIYGPSRSVVRRGSIGAAATLAGYYGEFLQLQVVTGKISYEWYMGYMSDLFLPASMVSVGAAVGIAALRHNDKFKWGNLETKEKGLNTLDKIVLATAGLVVAGATLVEYLDSTAGVNFDWKDVVCYAVGTSVAYGIYRCSRIFEKD